MIELDGFHLRLICAPNDLPPLDAVFQAELRALMQPLSLNDSGLSRWDHLQLAIQERPSFVMFVPIERAMEPALWEGIIGWIKGQSGRTLKLRLKNMEGDAQSMEEIVPLLEKTLKALTAIAQQNKGLT